MGVTVTLYCPACITHTGHVEHPDPDPRCVWMCRECGTTHDGSYGGPDGSHYAGGLP